MTLSSLLSNPLFILVICQLIAGTFGWAISWFTSEAETREEQASPFFAGLMAFCRGVGIDPPRILAGLRDMALAMVGQHPAQKAAKARAATRGFVRPVTLMWLLAGSLSALAVVAALTVGCAAKPLICPIITAVDELCPLIMVRFPDGHTEAFRREDLIAGARKEAAARAATDGGK